ncbi:MAG: pyridoxal phosphate-dependent aminotransferase [Actinomycetota bacterium]|nr:pyridoxal phosphate-dependent aminotransferase [Actinomycetota bacterium]
MPRRDDPLVPRMAEHATSVFGEMSALAAQVGAINLGQGFPDTDGPQSLKDAAIAAILDGRGNQYPPAHGIPALREAIAEHQRRFYGLAVDPVTEVVVGTGASEVIQSALLALVDDGDEVVMFEPWFDIYGAGISLARGTRVGVPMSGPLLRPDLQALRSAMTERTRVILLNSPHNPTGVVFTQEELAEVARIAIEHDVYVISDEAYEHLWFDDHRHVPIASLPGMHERTVTIGSGGKSFSFTGWKIGWGTGPQDLIAAVRTVRQHLSYVSGGPFQFAMAHGLGLPDEYFTAFRADLQHKRDLLASGLADLGMRVIVPQGTYFVTTDVRPLGFEDGLAFCRELPRRAGVVAIPHSAFCDDRSIGAPYVRWAFCKRPSVLTEALERMQAGLPG